MDPRVVTAGEGRVALDVQLAARRQEREQGTYSKGHIEEVLLGALQVLDNLPEPERELEVRTDGGMLVTVPDFAWQDRKLAVYCDGYQYHGDRDTLELDAVKRNFLAQHGWTVLTYWGRQILNTLSAAPARSPKPFERGRGERGERRQVSLSRIETRSPYCVLFTIRGATRGTGFIVEAQARRALGFLDLDQDHDGVTTELKVERTMPMTQENCDKYLGQPAQYATGANRRLSILVVLDISRKQAPPGALENYVWLMQPAEDGLTDPAYPAVVAVAVINANNRVPSGWSRHRIDAAPLDAPPPRSGAQEPPDPKSEGSSP